MSQAYQTVEDRGEQERGREKPEKQKESTQTSRRLPAAPSGQRAHRVRTPDTHRQGVQLIPVQLEDSPQVATQEDGL